MDSGLRFRTMCMVSLWCAFITATLLIIISIFCLFSSNENAMCGGNFNNYLIYIVVTFISGAFFPKAAAKFLKTPSQSR